MARRKSKKKESAPFFDDLSPHVKQSIWALLVAAVGIFFILSITGYAGLLGDLADQTLGYLFGAGAYLAPLVCAFYVYALLNPRDDERVSLSKVLGIALAFLSSLGFLELYKAELGGMLGYLVGMPFTYLFGPIAAGVFLAVFLLSGLFLTFNTGLSLAFLRQQKDEEETEEDISNLALPENEEESTEEEAANDVEKEDETIRRGLSERLGLKKNATEEFAVTSFVGTYDPPPLSLLSKDRGRARTGDVKANANTIKRVLKEFGINVEMDAVEIGPTVTRYSLKPAQGVKISRIVGLQRELELNLASGTLRIEAPIPGKSLVGIEVPNTTKTTVGLASLLASPEYTDSPHPLLTALGKDITGQVEFADIARMPHSLIAGTTGSGKSVTIHNIIVSLLFRNSPEQLRFIMVDPKRVELTLYDGIPHLLTAHVITDAKKALLSLKWAIKEMERRYDILQAEKVQNLDSYHSKIYQPAKKKWEKAGANEEDKMNLPEPLPYIVIVIDELADLMHAYPRELEALIVRLAQMSRAVGIHLILATQRPSVNIITGTIKANIPTRIALQVASQIDSRTILDQVGAERLLGRGDMLFLSGELSKPTRLQGAFVSEDELKNVVDYLKNQTLAESIDAIDLEAGQATEPGGFAGSLDGEEDDDLYEQALEEVTKAGQASTSFLQRRLRVGYARAARLMDLLEERGMIGPKDGAKPRTILTQAQEDNEEED